VEIAHGDLLGYTDFEMTPLLSGYAQRERMQVVQPFIRGDVLDIGCGATSVPEQLSATQSYVGIDKDQVFVDYCAGRYPNRIFYQRDLDAEDIALDDQTFDTVIMTAVIEHLQYPERVLRQIHPLLSSEGLLLLTTPTRFGDLVHQVGGRLGLFCSESWVEHVKIFRRHELFDVFTASGYDVVEYRRFGLGTNQLAACRAMTP